MEIKTEFVIAVAGKAGQGVLSMADVIQQMTRQHRLYSFVWVDYPSLIKGGHNIVLVRISDKPVYAPVEYITYLVALDEESIQIHAQDMQAGGVILYDPSAGKSSYSFKPTKNQNFYTLAIPFYTISKSINKSLRYANTAAIAALHYALNWDISLYQAFIAKKFQKKNQTIIQDNIQAIKAGYEYAEQNYDQVFPEISMQGQAKPAISLNGSQAVALGAIKAGVKFTAAYPMTPATPIFDYLAEYAQEYDLIAQQAEDEISAICMTLGASYAGLRALTMSSGGGFSLMVETLGLAGISETPLVVVNAMRGGPSTGLPTKTEQSDLRFVLHASQGEFPRVVLAPGDIQELYIMIQKAFNLAEMYQLPVILLTDKYLATSQMQLSADFDFEQVSIDRGIIINNQAELPGETYARYAFTGDGISPRVLPGTKGLQFHSGSDEHNQYGEICEDSENRVRMMNKRLKKERSLLPDISKPVLYGNKNADLTLISWGSTKWACIEATEILLEKDIIANTLHFSYIYPLPIKKIQPVLNQIQRAVIVENNATGQFAGLLKQYFNFSPEHSLLKYDGHPFFAAEIARIIYNQMF